MTDPKQPTAKRVSECCNAAVEGMNNDQTGRGEWQCTGCKKIGVATKEATAECKHDYENPVRKGRANLRCKDCDADITMELVLMEDMKRKQEQPTAEEIKEIEKLIENALFSTDSADSLSDAMLATVRMPKILEGYKQLHKDLERKDKLLDLYAIFMADVLDGVQPEEAYRFLNKGLKALAKITHKTE